MKQVKNLVLVVSALVIMASATVIVRAQTSAEQAKQNGKKASEYVLPYPGILPGNPLYNLKMVRDRVLGFLVADKVKRADFYLLQSDKRMAAGEALIKNNKHLLAERTMSRAVKYYEQSVKSLLELKINTDESRDLKNRLLLAGEKHQEILSGILVNLPVNLRAGYEASRMFEKRALEELVNFNGFSSQKSASESSLISE